jgi:aryl-alcohol dehydrogenase-like predicted oxidoreductase
MNYRKLGRTGLKVSPLCLGGNVFGWTADEAASFDVLDTFLEKGGNFVDTSDNYSRFVPGHVGGESETVIGRWFASRGTRTNVILATKFFSALGDGPNDKGLSRYHIMQAVENSLRRLQTDYIDLYQSHYDDPDTDPEETLRAYDDLVRSGKVRYIGCSNFTGWRLMKSLWTSDKLNLYRYESVQPYYNIIDRADYETNLEPICLDQKLAVIPYSTLASGFLSGKYKRGEELPSSGRAAGVQRRYMNDRGFGVLEAVQNVASNVGATPAQVSLAWLMARPSITAPIASATSREQAAEIVGACDLALDKDAIAALDSAGK